MSQSTNSDHRPGAIAAMVALALVAWAVFPALPVPLLGLLAAYLLYPYRTEDWASRLLVVDGLLVLAWVVAQAHTVFAPFAVAGVVAYLVDPLVDRIEGRRVPRVAAIFLLMIPVGIGVVLAVAWLVPLLAGEAQALAKHYPAAVTTAKSWMGTALAALPLDDLEARLQEHAGEITAYAALLLERLAIGAGSVGRGVGAVGSVVSYAVLTPILTFYLLKDWDRLVSWASSRTSPRTRSIAARLDGLLGAYFRGQLLVCLCVGGIATMGMALLGVESAVLIGVIVGLFNIVPVVGPMASAVPAVTIALFSADPVGTVWRVLLMIAVAQLADNAVLSPRIVGGRVGLHPVLVMLAIVVFPLFWGFVGLLLAVPAAAALRVLAEEALKGDVG